MFTSGRKIKIKKGSNYGKVLSHCKRCIKIKGEEIKMEATGSAIEKLINITEDLKILIPGLHQNNFISSIYKNQLNYTPLFQITLSLKPINTQNKYGSQNPISESERQTIKRIYKTIHSLNKRGRRPRRGIIRRRIIRGMRGMRGIRRIRGSRGMRGIRRIRGMRGMRGGRGISEMRGMRGMRGGRGISEMRGMRGGRGGSGMRESSENEDDLGFSNLF